MARVAPEVPNDSDLLCEDCGYILNGLPDDGRCPECGKPVAESTADNPRRSPPAKIFFLWTAWHVLFRPTQFYQTLVTRGSVKPARNFAWIFYFLTTGLTLMALGKHIQWMEGTNQLTALNKWLYRDLDADTRWRTILAFMIVYAALPIVLFVAIEFVTRLAAKLTAWEAAYRGLRMPYVAVLRALYFHAVHYVPAILFLYMTIYGYQLALQHGWLSPDTGVLYLYTLSGEVILAAIYLFVTYWIAMKNIMYANR
jgi:hypothetical protein